MLAGFREWELGSRAQNPALPNVSHLPPLARACFWFPTKENPYYPELCCLTYFK